MFRLPFPITTRIRLETCLQLRAFSKPFPLEEQASKHLYSTLGSTAKAPEVKKRRKRRTAAEIAAARENDAVTLLEKAVAKTATKPKNSTKKAAAYGAHDGEAAEKPKRRSRKRPSLLANAELTPDQAKLQAQLKDVTSQRMPLSLLENPWNDINRYLKITYGSKKVLGDKRRQHIINESLCDDVLQRLEPTLEKHVGCDILDINPGVCLWSKKIHERLRPRKHILLEPDTNLYQPFLLPLLAEPDSKYELVPKSGIVWSHLETVLNKASLPQQERYERNDPRLEERNDTLLVLVNLSFYPMKPYRGFSSLASLVLYQFMSAARSHSLFHRYGRVRFMVWTNDEEKRHILPRELHHRRKTAVEAELTFQNVHEVASTTVEGSLYSKEKTSGLERGKVVLEKMKAAGLITPPRRESVLMEDILSQSETKSVKYEGLWGMGKGQLDELADLENASANGEFPEKTETGKNHPMQAKLQKLRVQLDFIRNRNALFDKMMDEYKGLVASQKDFHARQLRGENVTSLESEFQMQKENWNDRVSLLSDVFRDRMGSLVDSYRASCYETPLMLYDRRDYEPLRVHDEDFFPAQPLCLLDFQPRTRWPILSEGDGANQDVCDYLIASFFTLPTQSIKKALQSTAPGAFEFIRDNCPSLTDPTKGGALDLDMLHVRTLSEEMLKEIVTAWIKWPWKPSRHELIGRHGAAAYDAEERD